MSGAPMPPTSVLPTSVPPGISPRWSHGWSVGLSVVLIVLGVIAVVLPEVGGLALTLYFGWLLVMGGVTLLVFGWRTHAVGVMPWQMLVGVVYVLIGALLVARPEVGLASLTLLLAGYLLIEGLLELVVAFRTQAHAGRTWLIVDGVVALVVAAMIVSSWPSNAGWVVGTLVGINLIFGGVSRLMVTGAVRRHAGLLPGI